jgi:hypothetical protein
LINNPGVPQWWPAFCLAYDVAAAAFMLRLIHDGNLSPQKISGSRTREILS